MEKEKVISLEGNGTRPSHRGIGYSDSGEMFTLNTIDRHAVCYPVDSHPMDGRISIAEDGVVPTLTDKLRKGSADGPLVLIYRPTSCNCTGYEESDTSASLTTKYHYGQGGDAALIVQRSPEDMRAYAVENHPADSRVKICEDDKVQTLSSRMGTGGNNVPLVMHVKEGEEDMEYFDMQRIGEYGNSGTASTLKQRDYKDHTDLIVVATERKNEDATARDEILQILRAAYGEKAVQQWRTGMLELLQQKGVLRSGMHEESISEQAKEWDELDYYTQLCKSDQGRRLLRNLRESWEDGRTPHRRKPDEQLAGESSTPLQELSREATQKAERMLDLWEAGEGARLLQQALSPFQEVRQSVCDSFPEGARGNHTRRYIIRRLLPIECAKLQGFPEWWTEGVEGSDSAKYKMWGNGVCLQNCHYILNRIVEYEKRKQNSQPAKETPYNLYKYIGYIGEIPTDPKKYFLIAGNVADDDEACKIIRKREDPIPYLRIMGPDMENGNYWFDFGSYTMFYILTKKYLGE